MKQLHTLQKLLLPFALVWTFLFLVGGPVVGCTDGKSSPESSGDASLTDGTQPPELTDGGTPKPTPQVPCPPSLTTFRDTLWEPLLSSRCLSCHNAGGVAKSSRLVLLFPSDKDALVENFKRTLQAAVLEENGTSILLSRPTGIHSKGHPGGALVSLGSTSYLALQSFVEGATGVTKRCDEPPPGTTNCTDEAPGRQLLRRLTHIEYDNTVQDLFGFPSKWGERFVADSVVEGFHNNAAVLTVTPLLADQLRIAAEEIAAEAIKTLAQRVPCDPKQNPTRACAEQWIRSFGKRAYRAPLLQSQVDALLKLFDVGAKQSFERGIELTITGMLQSPYFLYRRELGTQQADGMFHLSGYEIASSLSYLFWGSMPDAPLFQAADAGKLSEPSQIAAQAKRLLASTRSRYVYDQFFQQWLLLQRISSVPKDAKQFPGFTPALRSAMAEESRRFVWHVMEQGKGTLDALLTSNTSVMNKALATFYGVPAPTKVDASGYGLVTFADKKRGGLLTLGSVLAVHARPDSSSPIHRGVLVRERMLCQHLPPPPANVDAEPPGLDPKKTTRERYAAHSKDPTCAGCHQMIDPIGFGFEQFDGVGRYREKEAGQLIDVSGEILHAPNTTGTFKGVGALSEKLAQSADVHQCFTLQWMRWAYGVKAKTELACALKSLGANFSKGDRDVKALLVALTQTKHFRMRMPADGAPVKKPESPTQEPPPSVRDAGVPERPTPPEPPPSAAQLKVEVETKSKWNEGYCNEVTVTNQGSQPATWSILVNVEGTINQLWNALSAPGSGTKLRFSGVEWNKDLKPNQSAQFGFCAMR